MLKRLRWLAENFEAIKSETLTGEWQGVFKLHVGDYRVLYTCDRATRKIVVHFVRHRREVYKIMAVAAHLFANCSKEETQDKQTSR
ncbi:MAG: type II toxin-antitoxin system RelE/ParE family toxin [Bacillota bacterium]